MSGEYKPTCCRILYGAPMRPPHTLAACSPHVLSLSHSPHLRLHKPSRTHRVYTYRCARRPQASVTVAVSAAHICSCTARRTPVLAPHWHPGNVSYPHISAMDTHTDTRTRIHAPHPCVCKYTHTYPHSPLCTHVSSSSSCTPMCPHVPRLASHSSVLLSPSHVLSHPYPERMCWCRREVASAAGEAEGGRMEGDAGGEDLSSPPARPQGGAGKGSAYHLHVAAREGRERQERARRSGLSRDHARVSTV